MSDDKIAILGIIFLGWMALLLLPYETSVPVVTGVISGLLGWLKGVHDAKAGN